MIIKPTFLTERRALRGEGDVRSFHELFGFRPSDLASLRASSIAARTDAGFIPQSRASAAIDIPPSSARKKNPRRARDTCRSLDRPKIRDASIPDCPTISPRISSQLR